MKMFNVNYGLKCIFHNNIVIFREYSKIAQKSSSAAATNVTNKIKLTFGQPTHDTHPHLINRGEITPLITSAEYKKRRNLLLETIVKHSSNRNDTYQNHLVVVPSGTKKYMSDKIPYPFRQNTDFLYLTGCLEPDSCLILQTDKNLVNKTSLLLMRDKDERSELWDGPRTGPEQAQQFFGVDKSLSVNEFHQYLDKNLEKKDCLLWYDFLNPVQHSIHKILEDYSRNGFNISWENPAYFYHKLRLIKSQSEIDLMQKSCDIASEAIVKTIRNSTPPIDEHKIYAMVDYECRIRGASYLAYPPVVAGGKRANIIHYINNNQIVNENETVLMDAGCEYFGYSSDITRTWPVSGKFNTQQREIYEMVLNVQKDLINLCNEYPSLDSLFHVMMDMLGKGLQGIGLLHKSLTGNSLLKQAYEFCPHHVSHYLGMDVHDTPTIPRDVSIKPGMIITVEPGIYINEKMKVPNEYKGIGVRIEDDVLITEDGPLVLTRNCPKEIDAIEGLVNQR